LGRAITLGYALDQTLFDQTGEGLAEALIVDLELLA